MMATLDSVPRQAYCMAMARITKAVRTELRQLGQECAARACEIDDDAIEFPEESAIDFYPYRAGTTKGCPLFAIFQSAFVAWIRETYDADRVAQ